MEHNKDDVEFPPEALRLVKMLKVSFGSVMKDWQGIKNQYNQTASTNVLVSKSALKTLSKEVSFLKEMLPKVLRPDLISCQVEVHELQDKLHTTHNELQNLSGDVQHWKSRCETAQDNYEQEKKERFYLQHEVQEISEQVHHQAEYCAKMGSTIGTLLWRVSKCEDSIATMLVGAKVDDFFKLVHGTLESYMNTFKDELPGEMSEETQFILALCGIITNIAASPHGRDFIISHTAGKELIDCFINVLSEAPKSSSSARVKNLILMSLYNVSINQKGLKYLSLKPGIIGLLIWILQGEKDVENKLHALKLIQSLICDNLNQTVWFEAREVVSVSFLEQLAGDANRGIQQVAIELMSDLQMLGDEQ